MNYEIESDIQFEVMFKKNRFNLEQAIYFLPENLDDGVIESEFIYPEATTDLRKILKEHNVDVRYLTENKPLLRSRKSSTWFGPTFLITSSMLINNPELVAISINIMSSYLYDFFKGTIGDKQAKFEIIIENKNKGEFSKIKYEGPVSGIKRLEKVINSLGNDNAE